MNENVFLPGFCYFVVLILYEKKHASVTKIYLNNTHDDIVENSIAHMGHFVITSYTS